MILVFALLIIVVLYRIFTGYFGAEHLWLLNFSPVAAVAMCGPVIFPRRLALLLPLAILLASDIVLNAHFGASLVTSEMLARYGAMVLITLLGLWLRESRNVGVFLGASLAGSIGYYLITNTVSWLTAPGYAKSIAGWWQAVSVGLPGYPPAWLFLRNSIVSDACFTMAFLGCLVLATQTKFATKTAITAKPQTLHQLRKRPA